MGTRKRWRLRLIPAFDYETAQSMKQAYQRVDEFRSMYASGVGRIHQVDVQVDEGDCFGWCLHDRIVFPQRASQEEA